MMMVIVLRMILAEVVIPTPAMNATELLKVNWMTMVRFSVPIANITSTVMVIVNHKTEVTVIHVMDLIQTAQHVMRKPTKMATMKRMMITTMMIENIYFNILAAIALTPLILMVIAGIPWMGLAAIVELNVLHVIQRNVEMVLTVRTGRTTNAVSAIVTMILFHRTVRVVDTLTMWKDQMRMVNSGATMNHVIQTIISLHHIDRNEV